MIRSLRASGVLLIVGCALVMVGCENTTPSAEERAAVETAVGEYLNALASAYSTFDLRPLDGLASPNEIAAVRKLIRRLGTTGDRLDSHLLLFEVDDMEIFREINATVRLVEVWDVLRYDATTGVEKGHTPNSIQYSLLQLRLVDNKWIVVGRSVLRRETPAPPSSGDQGSSA
jgi:hypothetical protein